MVFQHTQIYTIDWLPYSCTKVFTCYSNVIQRIPYYHCTSPKDMLVVNEVIKRFWVTFSLFCRLAGVQSGSVQNDSISSEMPIMSPAAAKGYSSVLLWDERRGEALMCVGQETRPVFVLGEWMMNMLSRLDFTLPANADVGKWTGRCIFPLVFGVVK